MSIGRQALARAGVLGCVAVMASAATPPQAQAAPITTKCGAVIQSTLKTEAVANFSTQSTSFVNLPGAAVNITIPDGESRCVKVRLSLTGKCTETAATDFCGVRMVEIGAAAFDPPANGIGMVPPSNAGSGAYTFQWVKRLEAGTHPIRPQLGVQNAMTTFSIYTWTFEVETSE